MKKLLSMGTILALLWGIATMWRRRGRTRTRNKTNVTARARRSTPRTKARRRAKPAQRQRGPVKQPSRPETVPAEVEV